MGVSFLEGLGSFFGPGLQSYNQQYMLQQRLRQAEEEQEMREKLSMLGIMLSKDRFRHAQKMDLDRMIGTGQERFYKRGEAAAKVKREVEEGKTKHQRELEKIRLRQEVKPVKPPKPDYSPKDIDSWINKRAEYLYAYVYKWDEDMSEQEKGQISRSRAITEARTKFGDPSIGGVVPQFDQQTFIPKDFGRAPTAGQPQNEIQIAIAKAQTRLAEGSITQEQYDAFIAQLGAR